MRGYKSKIIFFLFLCITSVRCDADTNYAPIYVVASPEDHGYSGNLSGTYYYFDMHEGRPRWKHPVKNSQIEWDTGYDDWVLGLTYMEYDRFHAGNYGFPYGSIGEKCSSYSYYHGVSGWTAGVYAYMYAMPAQGGGVDNALKEGCGYWDTNNFWHSSDDIAFNTLYRQGSWKQTIDGHIVWDSERAPGSSFQNQGDIGLTTNELGQITWGERFGTNTFVIDQEGNTNYLELNPEQWIWDETNNAWYQTNPTVGPEGFYLAGIANDIKLIADKYLSSTNAEYSTNAGVIISNVIGDYSGFNGSWTNGINTFFTSVGTNGGYITNIIGSGIPLPSSTIGTEPVIELDFSSVSLTIPGRANPLTFPNIVIDQSKFEPWAQRIRLLLTWIVYIFTFWSMYKSLKELTKAP